VLLLSRVSPSATKLRDNRPSLGNARKTVNDHNRRHRVDIGRQAHLTLDAAKYLSTLLGQRSPFMIRGKFGGRNSEDSSAQIPHSC
jgi:hypothetical protein